MSDIWKGDPASQETEDPWLEEECKNCEHKREDHFDRAGCTEIKGAKTHLEAFPPYERCHCTNFEVKE